MSTGHPIPQLAERGFELQAVLDVTDLPSWAIDPLVAAGFEPTSQSKLVMLGQAGRSLWESMESEGFEAADRFDEYSIMCVDDWVSQQEPDGNVQVVYPGDTPIPLGRMGEYVGWGRTSPLGLSIHAEYGPWFAHRIVFLTDIGLAVTARQASEHPCDSCIDKPCVTACPVGAVSADELFDIPTCASHRISRASECTARCLARNACPVGVQFRYGEAQMQHHYASGLDSIRRYANQ